jgi:hypothetical protein
MKEAYRKGSSESILESCGRHREVTLEAAIVVSVFGFLSLVA